MSSSFLFFLSFCFTVLETWTQDLEDARSVLYHWTTPQPQAFNSYLPTCHNQERNLAVGRHCEHRAILGMAQAVSVSGVSDFCDEEARLEEGVCSITWWGQGHSHLNRNSEPPMGIWRGLGFTSIAVVDRVEGPPASLSPVGPGPASPLKGVSKEACGYLAEVSQLAPPGGRGQWREVSGRACS
jgi:hypothetical protein